jgi:hypothetical protein
MYGRNSTFHMQHLQVTIRAQEWMRKFDFRLSRKVEIPFTIERIVLLDFIHRLVSQEQTKLRN